MIKVIDYNMFNKRGILIEYDNKKEIFFTEDEAEALREFLNQRKNSLETRILTAVENKKMSFGELVKELKVDKKVVESELMRLEFEELIGLDTKRVTHPDSGVVFVTVYKKKEIKKHDN